MNKELETLERESETRIERERRGNFERKSVKRMIFFDDLFCLEKENSEKDGEKTLKNAKVRVFRDKVRVNFDFEGQTSAKNAKVRVSKGVGV
jgi:hypothetical protein